MVLIDLLAIFICNLKKEEDKKSFIKSQFKKSIEIDIVLLLYIIAIIVIFLCDGGGV